MTTRILALLCLTTLSRAMDHPHSDLFLVIQKKNTGISGFPLAQLWQEEEADLSHKKSYNGKATTMSSVASQQDNHIRCRYHNYPFRKNSIKAAYMERPSTLCLEALSIHLEVHSDSYMGYGIKNVARGMCPFALMEIEWQPEVYMTIDAAKATIEHKWPLFDHIEEDPFLARVDFNLFGKAFDIACNGPEIATQKSTKSGWLPPQQFMTNAITLSKVLDELLTFYEQQGLGDKALLIKHINREQFLLEKFAKQPQIMFLYHGPAEGPEKFLSNNGKPIQALPLIPETLELANMLLSQGFTNDGKKVFDRNSFLSCSFSLFILGDAFVCLTQDNVKNFMKKNGFICPKIERKTSPHNGRKNVWIISAYKGELSPEQVIALFTLQYAYKQRPHSSPKNK